MSAQDSEQKQSTMETSTEAEDEDAPMETTTTEPEAEEAEKKIHDLDIEAINKQRREDVGDGPRRVSKYTGKPVRKYRRRRRIVKSEEALEDFTNKQKIKKSNINLNQDSSDDDEEGSASASSSSSWYFGASAAAAGLVAGGAYYMYAKNQPGSTLPSFPTRMGRGKAPSNEMQDTCPAPVIPAGSSPPWGN